MLYLFVDVLWGFFFVDFSSSFEGLNKLKLIQKMNTSGFENSVDV